MRCVSDVRVPVYLLVVLFGMGSWVAVNGLWVELPLLVDGAPEGWGLPSYIIIIAQLANIGPLVYTILNKLAPRKVQEKHGVFFIVAAGATACLLLVFLWRKTAYIGGVKHSTGLIFSAFLLSMADCTSSVVFLPYMSMFKPQYISALYIGEGLSGLLPSLVALGQGVGKTVCVNQTVNTTTNETKMFPEYLPPHFPLEHFFYFLFAIMITCGLSFSLLHYLPYCKQEHVSNNVDISTNTKMLSASTASYRYSEFRNDDNLQLEFEQPTLGKTAFLHKRNFVYLLVLVGIINALINGILPSVSSYATLPYGTEAYHLSNTLGMIANPLACALAFFLPVMSLPVISISTFLGIAMATFVLTIAAYSPSPPLYTDNGGPALIVIASVLVSGLMSFSKVSIASVLRLNGRRALLLCGIITQVGSMLGAILMFILVNLMHLFHDKQACI
ncbi:solute carrier family 52, riboflavin transporter, member 3-B-like [Mya arenaria]|uniref:solute carrier family 52, riboflavin transporter, member 3-B-like n=1 Tax=Mya arenaria TaxID=6604 RepID=UPI0022DEF15E|nr:solute carrier family 52, riboflavin transporter, member 3-B-like [Mya arenaria]